MLQLCAGSKGDAAHADVLGGDVVFLALVATGEGEAEGAQVIQRHVCRRGGHRRDVVPRLAARPARRPG